MSHQHNHMKVIVHDLSKQLLDVHRAFANYIQETLDRTVERQEAKDLLDKVELCILACETRIRMTELLMGTVPDGSTLMEGHTSARVPFDLKPTEVLEMLRPRVESWLREMDLLEEGHTYLELNADGQIVVELPSMDLEHAALLREGFNKIVQEVQEEALARAGGQS